MELLGIKLTNILVVLVVNFLYEKCMQIRKMWFEINIAYGFGKKWRLAYSGGSLTDYVKLVKLESRAWSLLALPRTLALKAMEPPKPPVAHHVPRSTYMDWFDVHSVIRMHALEAFGHVKKKCQLNMHMWSAVFRWILKSQKSKNYCRATSTMSWSYSNSI